MLFDDKKPQANSFWGQPATAQAAPWDLFSNGSEPSAPLWSDLQASALSDSDSDAQPEAKVEDPPPVRSSPTKGAEDTSAQPYDGSSMPPMSPSKDQPPMVGHEPTHTMEQPKEGS